jgi:hypothetical protein
VSPNLNHYTAHQLSGLFKIISYRKKFYTRERNNFLSFFKKRKKSMKELTESFVQTFCQYDFADSDYLNLQQGDRDFDTLNEWIEQIDIETILQFLTYVIWTDKTIDGYFYKKIKDGTIGIVLERLEYLIKKEKNIAG